MLHLSPPGSRCIEAGSIIWRRQQQTCIDTPAQPAHLLTAALAHFSLAYLWLAHDHTATAHSTPAVVSKSIKLIGLGSFYLGKVDR